MLTSVGLTLSLTLSPKPKERKCTFFRARLRSGHPRIVRNRKLEPHAKYHGHYSHSTHENYSLSQHQNFEFKFNSAWVIIFSNLDFTFNVIMLLYQFSFTDSWLILSCVPIKVHWKWPLAILVYGFAYLRNVREGLGLTLANNSAIIPAKTASSFDRCSTSCDISNEHAHRELCHGPLRAFSIFENGRKNNTCGRGKRIQPFCQKEGLILLQSFNNFTQLFLNIQASVWMHFQCN